MSQKTEMILCKNCSEMTMHVSSSPNNILHLILSIITGSAWFPIWMIILAVQKNPQCSKCGKASTKANGSKIFARVMIFISLAFVCLIALCTAHFLSSLSDSDSDSSPAPNSEQVSSAAATEQSGSSEFSMADFMSCAQGDEVKCKKVIAAMATLDPETKLMHLTKLCANYGSQSACDEIERMGGGQAEEDTEYKEPEGGPDEDEGLEGE